LKQDYEEAVKLGSNSILVNTIGAGLKLHKVVRNLSVDTKAARISISKGCTITNTSPPSFLRVMVQPMFFLVFQDICNAEISCS
jgi:hypothetical protein